MAFVTYTPPAGGTRLVTLSEADGSERLKAATTNVSLEQLARGVIWLDSNLLHAPGGVVTGGLEITNNVIIGGTLDVTGNVTFEGTLDVDDGLSVTASASIDGVATLSGGTRRRTPAFLADADQTVGPSNGQIFVLADNPAALRDITLRQSSSPVPVNGDWMRFLLKTGNSPNYYRFRREGSGNDLAFVKGFIDVDEGAGTSFLYNCCQLEVQLVSGVWRMVGASFGVEPSTDA
jgi:hypothetical protein